MAQNDSAIERGAEYLRDLWRSIFKSGSDKKKKNEAMEQIDELIANYGESKLPKKEELPDTPVYERIKYNAPTDESIKANAENELSEYKNKSLQGVENEINALAEKYQKDKAAAAESTREAERETEKAYSEAMEKAGNDMLKRGLARSSIAANKSAQIASGEAESKAKLYSQYNNLISELDSKISDLDVKREKALNDFNIAYAFKLTERINELKSERDKKSAEAIKYNNTLTEKEHQAAVDKQMKESDLYGEALSQREKENKLTQLTDSDRLEIYNEVAAELRKLNKSDAREIVLSNESIKNTVGGSYYYKLYDEFCR